MDYKELTQQVKALEIEQKEIERSIEAKIRRRDRVRPKVNTAPRTRRLNNYKMGN